MLDDVAKNVLLSLASVNAFIESYYNHPVIRDYVIDISSTVHDDIDIYAIESLSSLSRTLSPTDADIKNFVYYTEKQILNRLSNEEGWLSNVIQKILELHNVVEQELGPGCWDKKLELLSPLDTS